MQLIPDLQETSVLEQINSYRAAYGLPGLQLSLTLSEAALWKSDDMATHDYFAHDDGFRSWAQRLNDCGYDTDEALIGENIAAGNASGEATLEQWQASPPHNENLLNPYFTAVGIKRMLSPNPSDQYRWYWTMDLGSLQDTTTLSDGTTN